SVDNRSDLTGAAAAERSVGSAGAVNETQDAAVAPAATAPDVAGENTSADPGRNESLRAAATADCGVGWAADFRWGRAEFHSQVLERDSACCEPAVRALSSERIRGSEADDQRKHRGRGRARL